MPLLSNPPTMGTSGSPTHAAIIFNIQEIIKRAIGSTDLANLFDSLQTIEGEWTFSTSPKIKTILNGSANFESLDKSIIGLISINTGIDVTTATDLELFTVPTGKKIIITNAYVIPEEITGFTSGFSASIGINSTSFDSTFEIKDFSTLDNVNKIGQYVSLSDLLNINVAGDLLVLKITTAAVATTFKIKLLIFGFYI